MEFAGVTMGRYQSRRPRFRGEPRSGPLSFHADTHKMLGSCSWCESERATDTRRIASTTREVSARRARVGERARVYQRCVRRRGVRVQGGVVVTSKGVVAAKYSKKSGATYMSSAAAAAAAGRARAQQYST